jgi:hypothetical protein
MAGSCSELETCETGDSGRPVFLVVADDVEVRNAYGQSGARVVQLDQIRA